jgi:hypothetical protein
MVGPVKIGGTSFFCVQRGFPHNGLKAFDILERVWTSAR